MGKRKVLLVDDESLLLDLYSTVFLKSGFDCVVSNSADSALSLLQQGYIPDVILFDINMPEKSGFEFIQQAQKITALKNTIKIALTNEGQDGIRERLKELSIDGLLIKAQHLPQEIIKNVESLLEKRTS